MVLVLSVLCFGAWSLISAHAQTIGELTTYRFLTGLGLGAAMPNAVTLMSEYAPARLRGMAVNTMFCGFSFGVMTGGLVSAGLIPTLGWKSVLIVGGIGPIVLTVPLALLLPESVQFLAVRPGKHAQIARILQRIAPQANFQNCKFIIAQAARESTQRRSALAIVLSGQYLQRTIMLWIAYFMGLLIYYLLASWMPILFKDVGFGSEASAYMTSLFSFGGILGNLVAGWLIDRFNPNRTITGIYVMAGLLVILAGRCAENPILLGALIFACGMTITAAIVSMSAYAASLYPTEGRATGVSWMLGIGRIGGVASAFVGATLVGLGWRFGEVFGLLAVPAIAAAFALSVIAHCRSEYTEEENAAGVTASHH